MKGPTSTLACYKDSAIHSILPFPETNKFVTVGKNATIWTMRNDLQTAFNHGTLKQSRQINTYSSAQTIDSKGIIALLSFGGHLWLWNIYSKERDMLFLKCVSKTDSLSYHQSSGAFFIGGISGDSKGSIYRLFIKQKSTKSLVLNAHPGRIKGLFCLNKILVTGCTSGHVKLWNDNAEPLATLSKGTGESLFKFAYLSEKTILICANAFGLTRMWNVGRTSSPGTLNPLNNIHCVTEFGNSTFACGGDRRLQIWDVRCNSTVKEFSDKAQITSIARFVGDKILTSSWNSNWNGYFRNEICLFD